MKLKGLVALIFFSLAMGSAQAEGRGVCNVEKYFSTLGDATKWLAVNLNDPGFRHIITLQGMDDSVKRKDRDYYAGLFCEIKY